MSFDDSMRTHITYTSFYRALLLIITNNTILLIIYDLGNMEDLITNI